MNLAALDLNLLVALEALVEEASVTRAARRVSLSQPAMSHALKRLRALLHDPLLVRGAGRMQLTRRAEALREPLRDALTRVRDLLAAERFDPATSERTFRLRVADNACDLLLPPLLARLAQAGPGIRIELRPLLAGDDAFATAQEVDVAVACVPAAFPGFYRQRLFRDRDVCALRRGHPLARRLRAREPFLAARHVAVAPLGREDPVDVWLREAGLRRAVVLTVPHYVQALHVAAQSDLVAVIPERLVRAYAATLKLRALPLPLDAGTFDEYLLHPARTHADPGGAWLRGVLKEVGAQLERSHRI
jgi:DNA-binding transcriptional LysR family regulator